MDEDATHTSSFEAFAQAYRAARGLDVNAQLDPESGTALVFADVCLERAQQASQTVAYDGDGAHAMDDDDDALAWETEEHTWKLVQALFSYVNARKKKSRH